MIKVRIKPKHRRTTQRRFSLTYIFSGCLIALSVCANAVPQLAASKAVPLTDKTQGAARLKLKPAIWSDPSGLPTARFGSLVHEAVDGNQLSVHVYRATDFDPVHGPIWFIMHGAKRNGEHYRDIAAPVAERYSALAVAIEFSRRDYPRGDDYTLGVTRGGQVNAAAYRQGRWRQANRYLYIEVERVFEALRESLSGSQAGYYIFGHSAGAQFTHRLITFVAAPRVLGAVVANAGWYTLPRQDRDSAIPYGLHGSPLEQADLRSLLGAPIIVLLGSEDTTTPAIDRLVRGTPEAMLQGKTRLARGLNYFETGRALATKMNSKFAWRLAIAPAARHSAREVVTSAGFLLFSRDTAPCRTGSSDGNTLVINEILADPPRGASGDANNDGVRDPVGDEFVEIVNAGASPVCMAGWTLNDASGHGRHLFGLGADLDPGEAIVVFGGGVPSGSFGGADVQRATSRAGLSLSNAGDVLTLRDGDGRISAQISWGDCAANVCAKDHRNGDLGIASSLVRDAEPAGNWVAHRDLVGSQYSPGFRADGASW